MAYVNSAPSSRSARPPAIKTAQVPPSHTINILHKQPSSPDLTKLPTPLDEHPDLAIITNRIRTTSYPITSCHLDNSRSWFVSTRTLLHIRIIMLIYVAAFVGWRASIAGPKYWYFFTNWSWTALLIYLIMATVGSIGHAAGRANSASLFRRIIPWFMAATYTCILMATIVFWILLFPMIFKASSVFESISLVNGHLGNLIVAIVDLFLCRTAVHGYHTLAPALTTMAYVSMICIVHGTTSHPFPYPFMRMLMTDSNDASDISVLGALLTSVIGACIACVHFTILFAFARLRDWIVSKHEQSPKSPLA